MNEISQLKDAIVALIATVQYLTDTMRLIVVKNTIDKQQKQMELLPVREKVTYKEVSDILFKVQQTLGKEEVISIFSIGGHERLSKIPEDQYAFYYSLAESKLQSVGN